MVKFGGHIEALSHGDLHGLEQASLVPYNKIKGLIFENPQAFEEEWGNALDSANDAFRRGRHYLWTTVFDKISDFADLTEVRGSHPGNALQQYVESVPPSLAQELLSKMRQTLQASQTNSEALRKLVKKYDKHRGEGLLSRTLLPELYTSSLYAGQHMMHNSVALLRDLLQGETPDGSLDGGGSQEDDTFTPLIRLNSEAQHEKMAEAKMGEIQWLKRLVHSFKDSGLLNHLVAHRGFHHIQDKNDKRPIENSLSAYEIAWTSGIRLCECDIAMTKDEKLVLAHDENFLRLALDAADPSSSMDIGDLTFRELIGLNLKSGSRPPLLIDVLRSASAISPEAKLIIEIKPGNESAASALGRMLIRHPDLCPNVAMIMSFDAVTMHRLRSELAVIDQMTGCSPTPTHSRVNSFDHFGVLTMNRMEALESSMGPIGLSLSTEDLENLQDTTRHVKQATKHERLVPRLMLLTVADPPLRPCEHRVSVDDLSSVEGWLHRPDGALDGVYLQYEKKMLSPEGIESLRALSNKDCLVGVWAYSGKDPDDFSTFERLVNEGNCTYVNTDLPSHFRKGIE
ncbi:unnamed protein product [Cylindrotheca closterium]|uniref:GP-PDE domain-containing protein n=1 Tax=Cylindrotheca closterium TaxID=2856 RepID=A0AAD2JNX6_9STRA|nr:unnamed protein product [Cylindrotheca closterium]